MTGGLKLADGSAAAPSLTFASDPNTGIFTDAVADNIIFTTGGTEFGRFAVNYFYRGTPSNAAVAGLTAGTVVSGTTLANTAQWRTDANASPTVLYLAKSRSNAFAATLTGDQHGAIIFMGADGNGLLESSAIIGYGNGAPQAADPGPPVITANAPGQLIFFTTPPGGPARKEVMRLHSASARFMINAIVSAQVDPAGTATVNGTTIITQEKGDFRYVDFLTTQTISGQKTFNAPVTINFQFNTALATGKGIQLTPGSVSGQLAIQAASTAAANTPMFQTYSGINENIRAEAGGALYLSIGGVEAARLGAAGTAMGSATMLVTREKGDFRYLNAGGTGLFGDGTYAAPAIAFTSDPDTGFNHWSAATPGVIDVVTDGTNNTRFDGPYLYRGGLAHAARYDLFRQHAVQRRLVLRQHRIVAHLE